jgi:hypothetical protein
MGQNLKVKRSPHVLLTVVLALLSVVVLSGCGAGRGVTVTVKTPTPASGLGVASTPPAQTQTGSIPTTPSAPYPVVRFSITNKLTKPAGIWPFTAHLVAITENPNGFTGSDPLPPQDTYLMVQVAITSGITGRAVSIVPQPNIVCHAPGDQTWSYQGNDGYDQGAETSPDPQGTSIAFGSGQPFLWDAQWQVPEGTLTNNVKCSLGGETSYPFALGRVVGSSRLN